MISRYSLTFTVLVFFAVVCAFAECAIPDNVNKVPFKPSTKRPSKIPFKDLSEKTTTLTSSSKNHKKQIKSEESSQESSQQSDLKKVKVEMGERIRVSNEVMAMLNAAYRNIDQDCVKGAVGKCSKYWRTPSKMMSCAKNLLTLESARCLIG